MIPQQRTRETDWRWLWCGALLVVLLVQIPGLGNVDTLRRLQVTRSFWTDAPPVAPDAYPGFGVTNRLGVVHAWYGPAQSVLMLPADIVASFVEGLAVTPRERQELHSGVVATLTFPAVCAAAIVLAARWLVALGFTRIESMSGALGLLLASSFLHYSQEHMEVSAQSMLIFADAVCLWRWIETGASRWLAGAAGCVAASLLFRLPSGAEHFGPWFAAVLGVWKRTDPSRDGRIPVADRRVGAGGGRSAGAFPWGSLLLVATPVVACGLVLDRIYHYHRFGSWTGTYIHLFGEQARLAAPALSAQFPFDGDFWEGFLGPLMSPQRSVVLFDPLLCLLLVPLALTWRRLGDELRWLIVGGAAAVLGQVGFYARYVYWDGSAAWGNRFTLPAVHLLVVVALPSAMMAARGLATPRLRRFARGWIVFLVAISVLIQLLSVTMPSALEHGQIAEAGRPGFTMRQRADNLLALGRGAGAPPKVEPALWRLNLAPANLARGSAWRLAIAWSVWGVAAFAAGLCLRAAWREARAADMRDGFMRALAL